MSALENEKMENAAKANQRHFGAVGGRSPCLLQSKGSLSSVEKGRHNLIGNERKKEVCGKGGAKGDLMHWLPKNIYAHPGPWTTCVYILPLPLKKWQWGSTQRRSSSAPKNQLISIIWMFSLDVK